MFDRTCPKSKTYAEGGGGAGAAAEQLAFTASVLGAFCAGHGSPPNVLGVVGTWHCGLPTQSLATALLTAVWPQTTNESSRIKSDRIDDHSNDWKSYLLGGAGAGGEGGAVGGHGAAEVRAVRERGDVLPDRREATAGVDAARLRDAARDKVLRLVGEILPEDAARDIPAPTNKSVDRKGGRTR